MSDSEKLLVYYAMLLYLLRDDDGAIKMKEKYSDTIKGNRLFLGNILRILGLIYFRKLDINEALDYFKKAEAEFSQCACQYGLALSKYSIGVIYRSGFAELIKVDSSKSPESG